MLARLIPLEHSGRVRAIGWGVTKTSLKTSSSVSEITKLKNDVSFLKKEIMELRRKGFSPGVQSGGSSHMDNFDMDNNIHAENEVNHNVGATQELPQVSSFILLCSYISILEHALLEYTPVRGYLIKLYIT